MVVGNRCLTTHFKKTNKKEGRDRKRGVEKEKQRETGHESWTSNMDAQAFYNLFYLI
jgi:hypothetical protein